MKKLFFIIVLLVSTIAAIPQNKLVTVTLKNGTTLTGNVIQFNPSTKIVLEVGGIETPINMTDVSSVMNVAENHSSINNNTTETVTTPSSDLPNDTIVNITGVNVKFILIKGEKFKFGYDGHHSRSLDSEPVHDVILSPFYISKEYVSRDLCRAVMKNDSLSSFHIMYSKKNMDNTPLQNLQLFKSKTLGRAKDCELPEIEQFMSKLNSLSKANFQIPTEVQWFFCAKLMNKETTTLVTPMWIYSEFVKKVSMSDVYDPKGETVVIRGATTEGGKDDFAQFRLYDRTKPKLSNFEKDFLYYNDYSVTPYPNSTSYPVSPVRLIMSIK
jgi:small nuclear ribonucleoprotein (snRNP)-like protein